MHTVKLVLSYNKNNIRLFYFSTHENFKYCYDSLILLAKSVPMRNTEPEIKNAINLFFSFLTKVCTLTVPQICF